MTMSKDQELGLMIGDRFIAVADMDKGQLQAAMKQAQMSNHRRLEQACKDRLEATK